MRVAVLMGGWSSERDVSLMSGRACVKAAEQAGYDVSEIDISKDAYAEISNSNCDVFLNALHGPWGEDGGVQALLDLIGKPYTHSGVLASALAMDKEKAKVIFRQGGIEVPEGGLFAIDELLDGHVIEPPYVIKPNAEGSSFGVVIVHEGSNVPPKDRVETLRPFGPKLLVEPFIAGKELCVGVMGDKALCVTEIVTERSFYDYDAKYTEGGSKHILPADLPAPITERALKEALKAHQLLGCEGVSRADFRYDGEKDQLVMLEVNTQPGMTALSLVPEQAAHLGISFPQLISWMIEDAVNRFEGKAL